MSDMKMFRVQGGNLAELAGQAAQIEKSLQTLCEADLEALLGVRFLASEHSTGPVHAGRIDTLGLDENGTVTLRPGFTRDVRKIGHFGTGDLEVSLKSLGDLTEAQLLMQRAYDGS
jgi:hypothetical protein